MQLAEIKNRELKYIFIVKQVMNSKDPTKELERYERHYTMRKFWAKVRMLGKKAGEQVVYNALLLYYVLRSPDVPLKQKGMIVGALGYLILPTDLVPDFIPMLGFADDLSALVFAVHTISSYLTPEIRQKAKQKTEQIIKKQVES